MRTNLLGLVLAICGVAPINPAVLAQEPVAVPNLDSSSSSAQIVFDRLKALVGDWSGPRPDGRAIAVEYRLTAGGTVLVERWTLGPGRESLTLYHMDGADLLATHYCPIGNQPRLRLVATAGDRFAFEFRDATGLAAGEAHQHAMWIELTDPGAFTRNETYVEGDEADSETIAFTRIR